MEHTPLSSKVSPTPETSLAPVTSPHTQLKPISVAFCNTEAQSPWTGNPRPFGLLPLLQVT